MVKKIYSFISLSSMKKASTRGSVFTCLFLLVVILVSGCKSTAPAATVTVIPTVSTVAAVINLTTTTAQSGGVVTFNGDGTITKNGVCYSTTNQTPTTADSHTLDAVNTTGIAITSFTSHLTGLSPNTSYYVRAYAINSAGIGYGGVLHFTTSDSVTSVTSVVSTFAGTGTAGYIDGSAASALFNNPTGTSVDSKGDLYVSDSFNNLIREVSSGNVITIAGNQTLGYQNGAALSSEFYAPMAQAFDAQGNLYIADFGNNVIRKVTAGGIVSTYAGTGVAGYLNGESDSAHLQSSTDSLAMFNNPQGVAVDAAGNVFVADRGNNVIREIVTNGHVKTIAGNPIKGFIDATDEYAFFNAPSGVAVDSKDNVYVTDQGNSALRVVSSAGVVTTLIGTPAQSTLLGSPSSITVDSKGNVYFTDETGQIFEFTTGKVLYTIAGAYGTSGFLNGAGSAATFNYPQGIAIDASGNLYVGDQYNNCIRKIVITTATTTTAAVKKTVQAKK
jgi:sugar lactone lactonase YvrE